VSQPVSNATGPRSTGDWSLWAIASLMCSLIACPPLCLIGPLLGAVGLRQIRRRPHLRGRGLARAGIAVGLAWAIVWLVAGRWWHDHVRTPMIEGPRAALDAGLGGDTAAFRAAFTGAGATATDAEARAFLDELTRRYGVLVDVRPDPTAPPVGPKDVNRQHPVVPYAFRFDREMVQAEATFVIWVGDLRPRCKWGVITVRDPERGDLSYPVAWRAAPAPARARCSAT
jgi:hypothetical protein